MSESRTEQQPLLQGRNNANQEAAPEEDQVGFYARQRRKCHDLLLSKQKHYFILALVALDVSCLLAGILIALIDCDRKIKDDKWAPSIRRGLEAAGLVFSCLFLFELVLCLWAFGFKYLHSWFHILDALVIIGSFLIDILTHGIVEQVASLVIILRLWRFVKMIEELSLGASEQMEDLEMRVEQLEKENENLKDHVRKVENAKRRRR